MEMDLDRLVEQVLAAWNVEDPEERRRLVEATYNEAVEVSSPYGESRGIPAQLESIAQVRAQFPQLRCTGKVLAQHHGWVMDSWTTDFGASRPPLHGIDVSFVNPEGRIVKVISFSPVPPP
jgi:SnoaL-like domain